MEYPKMMEEAFVDVCSHCGTGSGRMCDETGCLSGFSQKCLEHYSNGTARIPGGRAQLPVSDLKLYEQEDAAKVIAIACKWCRNCETNHSEDCVVSLCRRSMEFAITGKELSYKGSSLIYMKELEDKAPELSQLVMEAYKQL